MAMLQVVLACAISFAGGVVVACVVGLLKSKSKVHVIKRFCPYL